MYSNSKRLSQVVPTAPICVFAELRGHGARGPRYAVRVNKPDGLVLIDGTTEPLFDAARVLLSRGITGRIELWDSERPFPRMRGVIEHLARKTVSETDAGICIRRYAERIVDGDFKDEGAAYALSTNGRPCVTMQASEAMEAA
jgi:hypothetical protein